MSDFDATLSASDETTGPATVGPVVRTLTGLRDANELELLLDIAESLRHLCHHADAAEAQSRTAIEGIGKFIKSNKRLQKMFS